MNFIKSFLISALAIGMVAFSGCSSNVPYNGRTVRRNAYDGRNITREYDGRTVSRYDGFDGRTVSRYDGFDGRTVSRYDGFDGRTVSRYDGFDGRTVSSHANYGKAITR